MRLEGEYAFRPSLSVEVNVPYTFRDSSSEPNENNLDTVEVALKYVNFAFQDKGVLLGGGIELGLPTGDDSKGIGSNNIAEIEPFLDFGYRYERLETIGFVSFGIPTNTNGADEADVEVGWNLSFLYHITTRLEALVELDGEVISGGEEDGFTVVNLDPGVKVTPVPGIPLNIGVGFRIPLTDDKEFDVASLVSVFWHF